MRKRARLLTDTTAVMLTPRVRSRAECIAMAIPVVQWLRDNFGFSSGGIVELQSCARRVALQVAMARGRGTDAPAAGLRPSSPRAAPTLVSQQGFVCAALLSLREVVETRFSPAVVAGVADRIAVLLSNQ